MAELLPALVIAGIGVVLLFLVILVLVVLAVLRPMRRFTRATDEFRAGVARRVPPLQALRNVRR